LILHKGKSSDIELLLSGAFSPLTGFMDQETYDKPERSVSAGGKERFLE
jgi:ATP sulfurylase